MRRLRFPLFTVMLGAILFSQVAAQTCGFNYRILSNSGTIYGLVLPSGVTVDSLPNQTSIVVVGKLLPYNASEYLNPEPNYGGTILVQVIESAATTQSATVVTVVMVSGTSTSTVVQTQGLPSDYQMIAVNGVLIRTYGACVTPLASVSPVPQYIVGVALVLGIIGSIIAYNRFRKS
jgi:hypothetical protein